MGYDLVTWSPRIGASGDDQYNVAEGTPITAGDSSGFSATPTIAEINASTGLNQVIGALNRRVLKYNTLFGTTLATVSYVTAGNKILRSDFTNIQSKINTMRLTEGFANYSFTSIAAGTTPKIVHLFDLRKSLRIAGTMTKGAAFADTYFRADNPWGTGSTESLTTTSDVVGGKGDSSGITKRRRRKLYAFNIPDYVTSITSAAFKFTSLTYSDSLESGWTIELYSSNTDDTPYAVGGFTGDAYNVNNLEGTASYSIITQQSISVDSTRLVGRSGTRMCFILGNSFEIAGTGLAPTSTLIATFNVFTGSSLTLVTDFGT